MSDRRRRTQGWRLTAVLVGVVAVVVASWVTTAVDTDDATTSWAVWLAVAFGVIGSATLVLVPRRSR